MTGKGEDYTTGSLLDYAYYKDHYKLIACNLKQEKVLYFDPKAIQQIEFVFKLDNTVENNAQVLTVLGKEKETVPEFSKGTVKVY